MYNVDSVELKARKGGGGFKHSKGLVHIYEFYAVHLVFGFRVHRRSQEAAIPGMKFYHQFP